MKFVHAAALILILLGICLASPSTVSATPYWGPEEIEASLERIEGPGEPAPVLPPSHDRARDVPSYLEMYGRIAAFLDVWQVHDPGNPNHGGIREGEHLPNIIQTDNTSEAIWVWTRYYELTGDDQYRQNILDAFTYSILHPAYLEEGGESPNYGYYRMYNCGWAAPAEIKYREIYGDLTYKTYGDSCASYIVHHTLNRFGNPFNDYVNPPVLSWALGNLYLAGVHESNQEWIDHAVQEAGVKVKTWVEAEPTLLANETWAMSGGATMWGLIASYFAAHPEEVDTWLALYKDEMDTFSSPGDFQNAWNGWYALGHRATGVALADPFHLGLHVSLTDFLVSEDGDDDGGIPARPQDTDAQDQTWVTNYLAYMGLSDILSETSAVSPFDGVDQSLGIRLAAAPNPFCASTRLTIDLAQPAMVTAGIYDPAGRLVVPLASIDRGDGRVALGWDGRLEDGSPAPAGVYLAIVRTPTSSVSRKIIRLR